jgi:hypothetical protein
MADAQEVRSTQEVRQTQTTIPDYAKRYVEDLLGQGAATIYRTNGVDSSGMPNITGFQPYRAYQGERVAQFSPLQQQAFGAAGQLQVPDQMYNASQIAQRAATMAGQSAYNPTNFQAGMAMAPNLERFQMGPAQQVYSRENIAPTMSAAQMNYDPRLSNYQMGAAQQVTADRVGTPTMTAARMNFDPNLRNYQMGPAQEVRTQSFARPGTSDLYMSPYMQGVVDIQQREAQRQAGIAATQRGAKFASAGAFGGARQAIENAEAQRNLATQMGDIQATGLQSAYQQAQQQFNADQARALAAGQSNQQAGLTVGGQNLQSLLSTQQLGTQTGLQAGLANLNTEQQAGVQNQAAYLQSMGMNQQAALQAALANQQAGLTVGRENLASLQNTQQLGANIGFQTGAANLNAAQQAGVQNQAAYLQTQGLNAQQAMQAALANQQAGLTVGGQNLQALQNTQNLGAQTSMQAQLANQQAGQNAAQLREQSAQYGAGFGLQGLQAALQGAGQLGQLGQSIYGQNVGNIGLQNQLGTQQQQQVQNVLGNQYQDYLNQENLPYRQLGFMSDMLRGLPLNQSTVYANSSTSAPQPSTANQILGLGTAALSAFGGKMFAKGGAVNAGLADLAIAKMA